MENNASNNRPALTVDFNDRNELAEIRVDGVRFATGGGDLWTAEFLSADKTSLRLCASARGEITRTSREVGDGRIRLFWRGVPVGGDGATVDAVATIEIRPDGSQAWSLAFTRIPDGYALVSTVFPRLAGIIPAGGGDALLPAGDHGARLHRAWRSAAEPESVPYPAFTPMVSAFFQGETGLYIAAEDPDARIKSFRIEAGETVSFETPVQRGAEGPRHAVVLAPLAGDWWSAARRYRAFALRQKWAARGPIRDNPAYPRRFCEIPLWINIHAHPKEAEKIRRRVKETFPDFPTGIHWHLWQHSGHDENYPEYFPAQPGTHEVIEHAQADGQEMLPYANGRLWSVPTAGFTMAAPYAVMNRDGSRFTEKYAPTTPELAVMCPTCAKWQKVVQDFTGRILDELGAGSLFLDQIGAAPAIACHDPAHGHPVGGGGWWFDGYDALLAPIHAKANARGAFLTTEGAGEFCLGMVDGYMQLTMRTPQDVPFHNAVYSGYTTYFCSPENLDDDDASFRALQARELLWGNALGWFLPDILNRPSKCEILRSLCAFRQANLDALAYGTLLDELRFAGDVTRTTFSWLGRRQNFMLFTDAWALTPTERWETTDVIGNWWRTDKGETVLLAANLTDEERTVRYRPFGADGEAALTLAPHELRRVVD